MHRSCITDTPCIHLLPALCILLTAPPVDHVRLFARRSTEPRRNSSSTYTYLVRVPASGRDDAIRPFLLKCGRAVRSTLPSPEVTSYFKLKLRSSRLTRLAIKRDAHPYMPGHGAISVDKPKPSELITRRWGMSMSINRRKKNG